MQTHSVGPTLEPFPGGFRPGIFVPRSLLQRSSCSLDGSIQGRTMVHPALGKNGLQAALSGTLLSAAHVPVRAAGRAGREGDAFWRGPRAEPASAAAGEDRRSAGASPRRPGLAGRFPPQPPPPPPPPQTPPRQEQRDAQPLGLVRPRAARSRGAGGECRCRPPAPGSGRRDPQQWGPSGDAARAQGAQRPGAASRSQRPGPWGAGSPLGNSGGQSLGGGLGLDPGPRWLIFCILVARKGSHRGTET